MTLYEMLDVTLYYQPVWIYRMNEYGQYYPIFKGTVNEARQDTDFTWMYLMRKVEHYSCDTGILVINIMCDNPEKEYNCKDNNVRLNKSKREWRWQMEIDEEVKAAAQLDIVKGEKEMRWEHVSEGLSFSDALMALKAGKKIAREGWNGKGMYVVYRSGYPEGIPANKNTADAIGIPEGSLFKVRPYLQMRCADGSFQMWLASQSDILEDDWQIVE